MNGSQGRGILWTLGVVVTIGIAANLYILRVSSAIAADLRDLRDAVLEHDGRLWHRGQHEWNKRIAKDIDSIKRKIGAE